MVNKKLTWLVFLAVTVAATVIIKLFVVLRIEGGWEPDEYMHLLQLKTVYVDFPSNILVGLTTWAKPLYTYIFGLVSLIPIDTMTAVRIANVFVFTLISLIIYATSRKLGMQRVASWWALMITLVSFNLWRSSLSGLTEGLFTLLVTASFLLLISKRYRWAMLLVGLSVLGRIEGIFFVLVWLVIIGAEQRRFSSKLVLLALTGLLPTFLWNIAGALVTGRLLYLFGEGYFVAARGQYGFGSVTHFIYGLTVQEAIISLIFVLGAMVVWQRRKLVALSLPAIFLSYLILQTVLWVFSILGSAGLPRYLICVIPFAILTSSYFWDDLVGRYNNRTITMAVIATLVMQFLFTFGTYSRGGNFQALENKPVHVGSYKAAGEWLAENVSDQDTVFADRPEVLYYSGRDLTNSDINLRAGWEAKLGSYYVWSKSWGEVVHNLKPTDFTASEKVAEFGDEVLIFRQK